jgi:hypothetical protein
MVVDYSPSTSLGIVSSLAVAVSGINGSWAGSWSDVLMGLLLVQSGVGILLDLIMRD